MPAINPRLTITLRPSTAAQVRRMSELTGNSQSALISDLLEANEGVFDRLITVLAAAEQAKEAFRKETTAGLNEAQRKIEKQLGLVLETVDEATAPILQEAERIARRKARGSTGGGRVAGGAGMARATRARVTPPSNRGVRSTQPNTKVHKKG
jgi:hypothetical protein